MSELLADLEGIKVIIYFILIYGKMMDECDERHLRAVKWTNQPGIKLNANFK